MQKCAKKTDLQKGIPSASFPYRSMDCKGSGHL